MRPLVALKLASLVQLALLTSRRDFHPLLDAPPHLPGVRLRLFPSGISYLSQVANNVLAEQLPRIIIPDVEHRLPGDQGVIYISRVKISSFIGDLSGAVNIVVPFNLTGQAEVQAEGLSVHLDSSIERAPNGSAHVSTLSCHSTIRAVDVINHNGGLQRLIRLHLSSSTPGVAQFLRTSCEGSFCLADLVPQLAETYPNQTLELSLAATRAPAVLFSEKKGGVISVNLGGVIVVFVSDGYRRKQAAVLDMEVVADTKLNLQNQNVNGSVELTKFDLTSRSAAIAISQDELSDIAILVSQMVEKMLNEMLANGFPLPLPHGNKLNFC
ncbi:LBP / BPI / CETP family protein [Necator americanus]|uniref:LBP / BPI / CETP family protein n=1 Tax=Necator americanus TaxID=51031 RepID=W2TQ45_NECAM|nr:LBP / BPI / CETP family protein [Necator americanus]ETN84200.1 LBP / BPI / CETP family protein [Necator americanus]